MNCNSIKTVDFSYVWKIERFYDILKDFPIFSPVFSVKGYENIKLRSHIDLNVFNDYQNNIKNLITDSYGHNYSFFNNSELTVSVEVVSNDQQNATFKYEISIRCNAGILHTTTSQSRLMVPFEKNVDVQMPARDLYKNLNRPVCDILSIEYKFTVDFEPKIIGVKQLPQCESNKTNLAKDLGKLFENAELSDVTFVVENKELKAHKAILSSRSQVFAAMFKHNMLENTTNRIPITDINYDVFQQMLRFIYCAEVTKIDTLAPELLEAADKYALENLKTICELELVGKLCTGTALKTLILAQLHNADQLKTQVMYFISLHFKDIIMQEDWAIGLTIMKSHPKILKEILAKLAEK